MDWNILVTRAIPEAGLALLREASSRVEVNCENRYLTHEELKQKVKGRDGVLFLIGDRVDAEVLAIAGRARIFSHYAVGYDNIDVDAATRHGIMVTNTPGVLTEATADLAWTLIFSVARRIVEADRFTRSGGFKGWEPGMLLGGDIAGKTLGIIGPGRIGAAVARRSAGFKMKVLYYGRRRNPQMEAESGAALVDLETLLRESDFVSVHVPLTEDTRHMIDCNAFRLMKNSAYLINTARGPVVDEQALVTALQSGEIAGAGLDVYEREPELLPGLAQLDNVVLAPHIGSATVETRARMAVMAAENLLAALRGEVPPNLVNPRVESRKKKSMG